MKFSKLFATSLLALAGASNAVQGSATGTQAFYNNAFTGYGFTYTISWDSPIEYAVTAQSDAMETGRPFVQPVVTVLPNASADLSNLTILESNFIVSLAFVNMATGELALPPAFDTTNPANVVATSFRINGQNQNCTVPGGAVELRFSNPKCSFVSAFTGSTALADERLVAKVDGTANLIVQAGNYLTASDDPSCASFSCMTPGHDKILRTGFSIGAIAAVPEASISAMFACGLAALALLARRRRT